MNDTEQVTERIDGSLEAQQQAVPELSRLLVNLLKGVLYREDDERLWAGLLRLQARVREQSAVLLLDLVLDEAEGFAFLKSRPDPTNPRGSSPPTAGGSTATLLPGKSDARSLAQAAGRV